MSLSEAPDTQASLAGGAAAVSRAVPQQALVAEVDGIGAHVTGRTKVTDEEWIRHLQDT